MIKNGNNWQGNNTYTYNMNGDFLAFSNMNNTGILSENRSFYTSSNMRDWTKLSVTIPELNKGSLKCMKIFGGKLYILVRYYTTSYLYEYNKSAKTFSLLFYIAGAYTHFEINSTWIVVIGDKVYPYIRHRSSGVNTTSKKIGSLDTNNYTWRGVYLRNNYIFAWTTEISGTFLYRNKLTWTGSSITSSISNAAPGGGGTTWFFGMFYSLKHSKMILICKSSLSAGVTAFLQYEESTDSWGSVDNLPANNISLNTYINVTDNGVTGTNNMTYITFLPSSSIVTFSFYLIKGDTNFYVNGRPHYACKINNNEEIISKYQSWLGYIDSPITFNGSVINTGYLSGGVSVFDFSQQGYFCYDGSLTGILGHYISTWDDGTFSSITLDGKYWEMQRHTFDTFDRRIDFIISI